MCGIVGSVDSLGGVDEALLVAQRDTMGHRGPDDVGVWISPDRRFGLGHRRLAIIDLSPGGHQPMVDSAEGREFHLAFNGEIYNYRDLRQELSRLGHQFKSESDSEVLLKAFRQWGTACLEHLRGMFAFAICDPARDTLFVARDRAGEKPLYYCHRGQRLDFASELKALFLSPSIDRVVDAGALDAYLAYGYVPGSMSIIRGVHKLPPGHAMEFDLRANSLKIWRYWELPHPPLDDDPNVEALTDQLEDLLLSAVSEQLVADVPVGVLLSGGVDSSLIAALAARATTRLHTFTIRFPGHGAFDEGPYARAVAAHIGSEHVELAAEPASVELLPMLAAQFDEPMADSSMVPTYLVSRLVREHATVAIGGDGGDELFGGYPHYSWIQTQGAWRSRIPRAARYAAAQAALLLPSGFRGRNYLVGFGEDEAGSLLRINLYFDQRARVALLGRSRGAGEMAKRATFGSEGSVLARATRMDFASYLPDDILVKVDRSSMLASLEVRAPFLDYRLIDFAFGSVPDRLRATRDERKVLLRRLAARHLPPGLDLRRKQGFSLPLDAWFGGAWGGYLRDVLMDRETPFQRRAIADLFTAQRRGFRNTQRLFALAMFELWRRAYGARLDD